MLGGVLGMDALAPGGAPDAHAMVMVHPGDGEHVSAGCSHTGEGSDHLDHADGTCAAAGIGSPYAPPALVEAVADAPVVSVLPVDAPASAENGWAPPDLSELQLLRIQSRPRGTSVPAMAGEWCRARAHPWIRQSRAVCCGRA
ncbi:DUF6153 family protein [Streptomyces sp. ISL-22]|uniref:DUF6153 family protein n=1 Tax=Streptomyces sp. ISL-22 TaxID=2819180 RepID=UPI0027E2A7C0|nr:DUF6153 family protein [Streptomyces sp. ISL-22]